MSPNSLSKGTVEMSVLSPLRARAVMTEHQTAPGRIITWTATAGAPQEECGRRLGGNPSFVNSQLTEKTVSLLLSNNLLQLVVLKLLVSPC